MTVAPRRLATPSSVNAAIKQIADLMRRANLRGRAPVRAELSWILFLRILDQREELEAERQMRSESDSRRRSRRRIDGGTGRRRVALNVSR